jgi:hypothetical protein
MVADVFAFSPETVTKPEPLIATFPAVVVA